LNQECEHLLAERVLDQVRLAGPVGADDLAEPLGLGCDAPLPTGPLQGCL